MTEVQAETLVTRRKQITPRSPGEVTATWHGGPGPELQLLLPVACKLEAESFVNRGSDHIVHNSSAIPCAVAMDEEDECCKTPGEIPVTTSVRSSTDEIHPFHV